MTTTQHTPEVLYGDTVHKQRAYADLSQRYAAEGNVFGAVHAAWAADVQTVQAVMWERVMIAHPQPDEQFFIVATTVAKALALYSATTPVAGDAKEIIEQARNGMATAFDPAAERLLTERYASLDHLVGLPHPAPNATALSAQNRLHGESRETLIARRKQTAKDCMNVAIDMHREGRVEDAMNQAWQADWATFEAYLLASAAAVGDESLVTVDMRWALAVDEMSRVPSLPASFFEAVTVIRDLLRSSLGVIEGARLAQEFEPVG